MTFGRSRNILWSLAALAAVLLFNLAFTPRFFDLRMDSGYLYGNLVDILNRAAPVVLTGLGMTLVIATGGIDLSVGSVMAISGAVASILITVNHAPVAVVIIVPLLITTIIGLWNGVLVAFLDIQPFIATLILMVSGRGIAQLITSGQIVIFTDRPFQFLGEGDFLALPFTVTISLLMFLVAFLGTRTTSVGTFIEAVGSNPVASSYTGIPSRMMKLIAYAFSGLCAGIAGLIVASDIRAADSNNAGLDIELDAILAVVLGGTSLAGGKFFLAGSVIGALIIQTLTTTILIRDINPAMALVVKAAVVIGVSLLQSSAFRARLALIPSLWRVRHERTAPEVGAKSLE